MSEEATYYVYAAMQYGKIIYIGHGKGDRLKHCVSGVSHNYKLNALHFLQPETVSVVKLEENLTKESAAQKELELIKVNQPECNIMGLGRCKITEDLGLVQQILRDFNIKPDNKRYELWEEWVSLHIKRWESGGLAWVSNTSDKFRNITISFTRRSKTVEMFEQKNPNALIVQKQGNKTYVGFSTEYLLTSRELAAGFLQDMRLQPRPKREKEIFEESADYWPQQERENEHTWWERQEKKKLRKQKKGGIE